jgi:uracil-DNA glycosylase
MKAKVTIKSSRTLNELLHDLSSRKSSPRVNNPYSDPRIANNLRLYLKLCKRKGIETLLVGEAPGYAGCAITGIPFTSCRVLGRTDIKFFDPIRSDLFVENRTPERTATMVWYCLEEIGIVPVFWNAFPFHPHKSGNRKSNRGLTDEEVDEGGKYLNKIVGFLRPKVKVGIGHKGEHILKTLCPNEAIQYVRHPSNGGRPEFLKGMNRIKNG